MTTEAIAAPAALEVAPVVGAPNLDGGDSFSAEQAFEAYQNKRNPPAASADDATAGKESAVEADAAPQNIEATGETQETDPQEAAPLDLPRSWTKEQADIWNALPRATQEFLTEQASKSSETVRRSQNEAAEARKAAEAERAQAAQEKEAYQSKLPALMQALQDVSDREFPEIKSIADYERLAMEGHRLTSTDPFRALEIQGYLKAFDAHQQKLVAVNAELQKAEGEKHTATQRELDAYRNEQDKKFLEYAPELSDPKKKAEITEKAVKALTDDLGLSMEELNKFASDPVASKLLYHSGFQRLLLGHVNFSDLKAAPLKAIPKPVPAVQKPGIARAPGAASADAIQASRSKLNSTGSAEDAFALYQAKKARAR